MNTIRRGWAALAILMAPMASWAHGGEDHGDAPAPVAAVAGVATGPRAVAVSALFEVVVALDGNTLVLYVDDYNTNAPVTGATVEVDGGGVSGKATETAPGVYSIVAPSLAAPGAYPLALTIEAGDAADLISAALTVKVPPVAAGVTHTHAWSEYAVWAGAGGIVLVGGLLIGVRRRKQRRKQTKGQA